MGKRSRENGALPVPKKIRLQEESAQPALPAQSLLKPEAIDFPRGGGTSLTAHEVKVSRAEGAREAKADAAREVHLILQHIPNPNFVFRRHPDHARSEERKPCRRPPRVNRTCASSISTIRCV
jgi:hypothetical protein